MSTQPKKAIRSWLVWIAALMPVALSQNSGAIQGTVYAVPQQHDQQ